MPFQAAFLLGGIDPDRNFITSSRFVTRRNSRGEAESPAVRGDQGRGGATPVVEMGIRESDTKPGRNPGLVGSSPVVFHVHCHRVGSARVERQGGIHRELLPGEKSPELEPMVGVRLPSEFQRRSLVSVFRWHHRAVARV